MNVSKKLSSRKSAKGFTIIEIGVVLGILLLLAFAATTFLAGSQQKNEWATANRLITIDVAGVMQEEMASRRSYARFTANAAGKALITGSGVTGTTPWGSSWTVSAAGSATNVSVTFPCTGAPDPARWCTEVANRVVAAASPMITSATVTGTNLVVVYRRPLIS